MSQPAELQKPVNVGLSTALFLVVMTLGYAIYAADRTVLASVLALITQTFQMTNYEIGLLTSAQYIGVLCVVFIAGYLSDRYGRKNIIILGVVVFTAFTWLIGLSTNFLQAFIFRLISGFGEGIFWPVSMAAVAQYFKGRKGLALGIFYTGFDVGSVAGLSLGGLAYSFTGDWRNAFFWAPSVGLIVILGATLLKHEFFPSGEMRKISGSDALELLRQRNVILILVFALVATWSGVWQVVFLPYYFFKVLNVSILSAALLSSVVAIAGGCGKVLLGGLSDIWRRNRFLAFICLAVLSSYGFFFATSDAILALIGAIAMGFFNSAIFPVMQALMADNSKGRAGTALGLATTFQSVGTVIGPVITASFFTLGVGRAVALNAMIPIGVAFVLALLIKEVRPLATRKNN